MSRSEAIVIVGAGHAAGQLVASLRHHDCGAPLVLLGEETWLPYQRPPLSKRFLAGELPPERLYFKPAAFYDEPPMEVHLGCRVERVERERKALIAADGREFRYGKLVLALGAHARRLPLPGSELAGIHYLRNIDDVRAIREDMGRGRRLVVIGGGYIGLEVAAVARSLGQAVTVVEASDRVMSRVVSPPVSAFFEQLHTGHGVQLLLDSGVIEFSGDQRVDGVVLGNGEVVGADTVVIGIGIEPNTRLAADAGLEVDNGIVVDDACRTRDPDIYAIGDCTSHPNAILDRRLRLESVHNALEQAKTAGANLCGIAARYAQVPWFWSDQYDVKLQIAGLSQGYDREVVRGDPASGSFSCVYLKQGRLIAIDAINRPKDFVQAKALIREGTRFGVEDVADASVDLKALASVLG